MAHKGKRVAAIGYMRTSSASNVGEGKDSEKRQRAAIEGYAESAGYVITSMTGSTIRLSAALTQLQSVPASRPCWNASPRTACVR
jgi:hypothetical protein